MASSFRGCVHSDADIASAILAVHSNRLPQVGRRMSEAEKRGICAGDVFVYRPGLSGIRRWTDGRKWSPSRITPSFMVYRGDALVKKCATGTVDGTRYCVVVYAAGDWCTGRCAEAVLGGGGAVRVHHFVRRVPRGLRVSPWAEAEASGSDSQGSERGTGYRSEKFADYMAARGAEGGLDEAFAPGLDGCEMFF